MEFTRIAVSCPHCGSITHALRTMNLMSRHRFVISSGRARVALIDLERSTHFKRVHNIQTLGAMTNASDSSIERAFATCVTLADPPGGERAWMPARATQCDSCGATFQTPEKGDLAGSVDITVEKLEFTQFDSLSADRQENAVRLGSLEVGIGTLPDTPFQPGAGESGVAETVGALQPLEIRLADVAIGVEDLRATDFRGDGVATADYVLAVDVLPDTQGFDRLDSTADACLLLPSAPFDADSELIFFTDSGSTEEARSPLVTDVEAAIEGAQNIDAVEQVAETSVTYAANQQAHHSTASTGDEAQSPESPVDSDREPGRMTEMRFKVRDALEDGLRRASEWAVRSKGVATAARGIAAKAAELTEAMASRLAGITQRHEWSVKWIPASKVSGIVRKYVGDHWNGRHSLMQSWGVNVVLINMPFYAAFKLINAADRIQSDPVTWARSLLILGLIAAPVVMWQAVGVWRAAGRVGIPDVVSASRYQRVAARCAVAIFVWLPVSGLMLGWPFMKGVVSVASNAGNGASVIVAGKDGSSIWVTGEIGFGLADQVSEALLANPNAQEIVLNLKGGRIVEARKLANLIASRPGLRTRTEEVCASACVLPFMAGRERILGNRAALGFHRYYTSGDVSKQTDLQTIINEDRAYMKLRGVHDWFLDKAFATSHEDVWAPAPAELFSAGVITGFDAGAAVIGEAKYMHLRLEQLAKQLDRIPWFSAMRRYDPFVTDKALGNMRALLAKGLVEEHIDRVMEEAALELGARHVQRASDASVNRLIEAKIKTLKSLQSDPAQCRQYIEPVENPNPNAPPAVSLDLLQEELLILKDVIASSASAPSAPMASSEATHVTKPILFNLMAKHGISGQKFFSPDRSTLSDQQVCAMALTVYELLMEIPAEERAGYFRFLNQS